MEKKILQQIDLMGSSSCDLKCSYCYINKNCAFFDYDKQIREAWETGAYLKTVQAVFSALDQSPSTITDLQLWGGEPTLHMPLIAKQGQALGELFPNITHFLIPTNWYNLDIKALVDFIYGLDKGIKPREKPENHLNFHIQASIDGPPGELNKSGHAVDWETYKKNFDVFCKYLKEYGKLNNITIVFSSCGTTTQHLLLKNLTTYDQISEFRNFYNKVNSYILTEIEKIKDVQLVLSARLWTPRIAISQTTTTEEAVELEKIIRLFEYHDYITDTQSFSDANEIQLFRDCQGESFYVNRNHECPESNEQALTIMPDGTIAECPCTFLQNLETYKQELLEHKDYWEYKSALIREPNFYNPLQKNEEKDKYHSWYVFNGGYLGTQSTYANLNLSMAYEMALSRQIDYQYVLNPELLMNHYLANFMTAECYREHVNVTHNHFLTDHNMIRRWFNGFTHYSYNDHLEKIKLNFNNFMEKYNEINT